MNQLASTAYSFTMRDIECLQWAIKDNPESLYSALKCFQGTCNKSADEVLNIFLPMAERILHGEDLVEQYREIVSKTSMEGAVKPPMP